MAGSIRPRPDRGKDSWELRVYLGRDSKGRVRHTSKSFRGSRRAAEKELSRLLVAQDFEPELPTEPEVERWDERTTVNDAIEGWKANGWEDLSPVTAQRYESVWNVHIQQIDRQGAHRHPHPLRHGAVLPASQVGGRRA